MMMDCPCCGQTTQWSDPKDIVENLQFGPIKRTILNTLLRSFGKWVSTEQLRAAVWGNDPDGGPISNALHSHCCDMNKLLKPAGLKVEGNGVWNRKRLVWAVPGIH